MIYCENTSNGWRFLVVWPNRPSLYCYSLSDAETAYHRSMCHAAN